VAAEDSAALWASVDTVRACGSWLSAIVTSVIGPTSRSFTTFACFPVCTSRRPDAFAREPLAISGDSLVRHGGRCIVAIAQAGTFRTSDCVPEGAAEGEIMTRTVSVDSELSGYVQNISIGPHLLQADEPREAGGTDSGPNPYELLMAALGACTSMTVRIYAERRRWPLQGVHVRLAHAGVHAEDCANCEGAAPMVERIDVTILLRGNLSEAQRQRLMDVAAKCPVHRTLSQRVQISTRESAEEPPPPSRS
jgi:uncharacterized OsmC-like protein